jgi:hypothetical protein
VLLEFLGPDRKQEQKFLKSELAKAEEMKITR